MKTIITGGCGFIGSHVCDLLVAQGHEVTVIDNLSTGRRENIAHLGNKVRLLEADLSRKGAWQEEVRRSGWVVHLAALADIVPSIQKPEEYFQSNVVGTFNVLQASHEGGVKRFVYAASGSGYGIPDKYPTPETAEIRPQYPYALTKRLGEEMVLHWCQVFKLPALSLRFSNVYGPRSRTSGVYGAMFGVFLAQKLAGKPFTIVGDGEQKRDFTYISDVAEAVLAALTSQLSGQVYNVGSGHPVSVNQIADLLVGKKVFIPKRPGEPDQTWVDISRIKKELGWSPRVSIEEGVSQLIKHIDYWREAPVWEPQTIQEQTKDWFKYLGGSSNA